MTRASFVVCALVLAALPYSQAVAKAPDPVAIAAKDSRRVFASGVAEADGLLASATANFTKQYASGAMTAADAASGYTGALGFHAITVKKHADAASASFATAVSAAMTAASDAQLRGGLAGDGGAFDAFNAAMQSSLDRTRARALGASRRFARLLGTGATKAKMNVVLPAWTFEGRAAPSVTAALAPELDSIRLLAAVATRVDDGRVIVGLAGRAPIIANGNFDTRLIVRTSVRPVGPLLSAGGIPVSGDGTWSLVATLNDPTKGEGELPGNRVIAFGVDPFDAGPPAGRQPGRYLHAGVIGVP